MEEFEQLVQDAVESIPIKFKKIIQKEKIEIIPRELVPRSVLQRFPGKIIFGVFVGVPYKHRYKRTVQLEPTRIELYKESFEKVFQYDNEMIKKEVARTVIHEIAHYFGFSEIAIRREGF